MKDRLNSDQLIQEIEKTYSLEENIAIKKDKWNRHVKKWECLKEIEIVEQQNYVHEYLDSI